MYKAVGPVARRENDRVSEPPVAEQRKMAAQNVNARQRQTLQGVIGFIGFGFTLVEGLIGLRVILRFIDASSQDTVTNLVYRVTTLFVSPFTGLNGNPAMDGSVVEITSIVAMIVYALVAAVLIFGLVAVLQPTISPSPRLSAITLPRSVSDPRQP